MDYLYNSLWLIGSNCLESISRGNSVIFIIGGHGSGSEE